MDYDAIAGILFVMLAIIFIILLVISICKEKHEYDAAILTCKDHNGVLMRSSSDVVCNDSTRWHWREGYIIEMK